MSIEEEQIEYEPSWIEDYLHLIPVWIIERAKNDCAISDTKRVVIRASDESGDAYFIGVDRHHSNGSSGVRSHTREFIIPKQ